jgi:Uma2 family endonuclease
MSRRRRFTTPGDGGRPATWEDLEEVPEGWVGEIVSGEIQLTPRPNLPHSRATSALGILVGGPFDHGIGGPGGWVILDEPRVRFGEDVRVPDLAGWRRERWIDPPRKGPIAIVPDWTCEALSPSTKADDLTVKLPLYARAKVGHVWLVDPEARTLEVYRLEPVGWTLVVTHAGDSRVRAEPFGAVEIDLSLLWLPPLPEDD